MCELHAAIMRLRCSAICALTYMRATLLRSADTALGALANRRKPMDL